MLCYNIIIEDQPRPIERERERERERVCLYVCARERAGEADIMGSAVPFRSGTTLETAYKINPDTPQIA